MKQIIKKIINLITELYFNILILPFLKKELVKKNEIIYVKNKIKVTLLKPNLIKEDNRYFYQKKYIDFSKYIKAGDKVLDIGSGGYPFPLATHLADFFEENTSHRSENLVKDGRNFINCDIENLPFKDKEFDFIYCSHVLEHVNDPVRACNELIRTGKRGYIETPTKTSDIMFNFTNLKNHHKWHIEITGNTIIFIEWKDSERRNMGNNYYYEQILSEWVNPLHDVFNNNRDMFVNMMLWEKEFDFLIINKNGQIAHCSSNIFSKV
jgi:2-polyprenyl-3-methyl-5-hydroxy-6-metoxy-1,4-benzoquinol methylase